jgi:hypothetical protein
MRSSLDEGKALFSSWRATSSPLFVSLQTAEVALQFFAVVKDDSQWPLVVLSVVGADPRVAARGIVCEASFNFAGVDRFEYLDPREVPDDPNAERKFVCVLTVDLPSENGATFCELVTK